ncbi:VanW family protein [Priestia flexa]|uniref:VanW family protein n=1 Tax=Priestia flexa TaxID=86664 RepID=UPI0024C95859|nr:VanW family protein [Priestia flexa]
MRNEHFLRIFLLLTFCTAYLLSFSNLGVYAYDRLFGSDGAYKPGTKIGSIDVAEMSTAQAKEEVKASIEKWKATQTIDIQYKEKSETLPMDVFSFYLNDTFAVAQTGKETPVSVKVNEELLAAFLNSFQNDPEDKDNLQMDRLKRQLHTQASMLSPSNELLSLESFLPESSQTKEVLAQSTVAVTSKEMADIQSWLDELKQLKIPAQKTVSLNELIQKHQLENLSPDSLSLVGSSIYETITYSNFDILERHIGSEIPDYIDPGFEARISPGKLDLAFFNSNQSDYTLTFELDQGRLTTKLVGEPFFYTYETAVKERKEYEPRTIVQYTAMLSPNVTNIETMGKNGLAIKVERTVTDGDAVITSNLLSDDFYPPENKVEQRGLIIDEEDSDNSQDMDSSESSSSKVDEDAAKESNDKSESNDSSGNSSASSSNGNEGPPKNNSTTSEAEKKTTNANEQAVNKEREQIMNGTADVKEPEKP